MRETHDYDIFIGNPMPAIDITPANPRRCAADAPTQLVATPQQAVTATYSWVPGNIPGDIINVSPTVTTTYTVVGNRNGCTNTAQVTVTVDPTPNVAVNPATTAICVGAPNIALTASGAQTYTWQPGNFITPVINVSPPVTTTYTVTGTSAQGCTASATSTVTVNSLPTVTIFPSAQDVCDQNLPAALIGGGAASYVWQPGNLTGAIVSVSPPAGLNTYTVTGTDGNACTGTATATVNVVVTPGTPGPIAGPTAACRGRVETYSVAAIPGINYVWNTTPANAIITPITPSGNQVEIEFLTTGNYSIEVYGNRTVGLASCNGPTRSLGVTVNDVPGQVGTISGPSPLCPGQGGTYAVGVLPNTTSYTWSVTAGPVGGATPNPPSTTNTIDYLFSLPGTYSIQVAATNACGSGTPRTRNVVVNPTPATPVELTNTTPVCPGRTGATYAVANVPGTTYFWNLPAGVATIAGGQGTNSITVNWNPAAAPGTYPITVTPTALGCVGNSLTLSVVVSPPTPLQPGPITGATPVCPAQVAVYDIAPVANATSYTWTGIPVGATITAGVGTNSITINWGTAAPGFYTLNVVASNSCGTSPAQGILVEVLGLPATPANIIAPPVHCVGTSRTYTVPPVLRADDYEWTNSCASWIGASVTNQIDYLADANGPCVITVAGRNACGTGPVASVTITPLDVPAQPSPINGPTPICRGTRGVYRVQPVAGVGYLWSGIPVTASVVTGQGTNEIEIDWGTTVPGVYNLRVTPTNACGASTFFRELQVTVRDVPAPPTGLVGPTQLCEGGTGNYTVDLDPTVSYTWGISPSGATVTNQGNAATVVYNTAGVYQLRVRATNECGVGIPLIQPINVVSPPAVNAGVDRVVCGANTVVMGMPGGGTWSCEFCPGASQITSAGNIGLVSGMGYGPHVFRYTVVSPECGSFSDFVLIENDRIVPGTITGSTTICEGQTGVLTLTGQTGLAQIIRWEYSTDNFATLPTPIQNTTASHTYVNLTQTTQFRAVLQGERGACPEQYSGMGTVVVRPRAVSQPGPALQVVCGSTATVTGNLPAGSTGEWFYVSGPSLAAQVVTIGTQGQVIGLSDNGDHVFRWRVGNAVCGFATQDVVVRKVPGATASIAGPFQQICVDTARVVGNGFEPWENATWRILQAPVGSTPFVTTSGRVGLLQGLTVTGKYILEWEIENPLCGERSVSQVEIERLPAVTAAVVPPNVSICANQIQLQGNVPVEGVGTWSYLTGPSSPQINQVGVFANITNLDVAGLHIFRYTIDNGVCPPSFSDVEVTVVQGQPVANVTALQVTVCGVNSTAVLEAVGPLNGTGEWRFVNGPSQAQVISSGLRGVVSGLLLPGSYQFEWRVMNACGMAQRSVEVVVSDATFTPAFGGADQFICDRSAALLAGNTPPFGGTGMWRFVSGPVVASVTTFGNRFGSVVNMDVAGEYIFEWVISVPGCPPSVSQVAITRVSPPSTAFAGPNQVICGGQTTLVGNVPVSGVGRWTYVGGPSPAVNVNYTNNVAVVTGLTAAGIHEFDYFIENAPCPASVSRVRVTVNPSGEPGLLSLQSGSLTVCSGTNAGTLQLSGYVGNIVRWESSEDDFVTFDIIPVTNSVYSFSNLTTTTSFRAIVRSGNCGDNSSNVIKIRVRPSPGAANAGPIQTVCGPTTQLQGNAAGPGVTGTWTIGGVPIGANPSLVQNGREATVTGMTVGGDYVFTWTLSVPGCGSSSSNVLVRVSTGSVGGTVSAPATVCSSGNTGVLTLSGQVGQVVRWERTTNNWVSTLPTVTTATTLVYTNLVQTTRYRAVVKDGVCPEAVSDEVEVVVTPAVASANGGPDQVICATTTELTGNGGGVAVGSWTQVGGPAANLQVVGSKLTVRDMVAGVYIFEYSLNNGACGTSVDQVQVTVNGASAGGNLTGGATVCAGVNAGVLDLSGQVGNVVRWERSVDNFATVFPIASTATTLGWSNLSQTTRYRAVVKSGVCPETASPSVEVVVVPATPAATVGGGPFTTCSNSLELIGSAVGSGSPVWTVLSGPGTPVLDVSGTRATVRDLAVGVTTVEYRIENAPCAPTTATVNITRVASPVGGSVTADQAVVCGGSNSVNFTLAGETGTVDRWETSTDGFITVNPVVNTSTTLTLNNLTQPTLVRAVVTSGTCGTEQSLAALVNVVGPLAVANAGLDQTVCASDLTLMGNDPGPGGTGTWSQVAGAGVSLTQAGTEAIISGLTAGVYRFRYEITGAPCAPSFDEVDITVEGAPVAGVVVASATPVCAGTNSGSVTVSGQVGTIVGWEISTNSFATFTVDNVSVTSYPYANLNQTTQYRAVIGQGNCPPVRTNPVSVVVDQPSVGGVVLSDVTVCAGSNGGNLVLQSQVGNIVRWERSTDAVIWSPISNTSAAQPYLNLVVSESFRAVVQNGVCPEVNSAPATVTVATGSIAGTIGGFGTVCSGTNSSVLVLSGQNGDVVRWEFSTDPSFSGFGVLNVQQPTLQVTNVSVTTYYRALVQSGTCVPAYTGVAAIVVSPPSVGGLVLGSATVCAGSNAGSLVLTGQTGQVVRWESAPDATFGSVTPISETGTLLVWSNLSSSRCYRAVVQNLGCPEAFSQAACIEVRSASVGGAVSGGTTVCAGLNSGSVVLSGQVGDVVRWESASDAGFTQNVVTIANTGLTQSYSNLTSTRWYRAVVQNAPCASVNSPGVAVVVDAASDAGVIAGAVGSCGGTANGVLSVSGQVGDVVRWESSSDNFASNVVVEPGPATANLSYSTPVTRWYRVVVRNGVCGEAQSGSVEVPVSSPSVGGVVAGGGTVCGGTNSGTLTLTGQVGSVVRWESASDAGFTQDVTTVGNTTPALTYSNLTSSRFYRAVVQNGACAAVNSGVAQVSVNAPVVLRAGAVVGCTGSGSISALASGGAGNFVYSLSPAVVSSNTSGNFGTVPPGVYVVTVVDGAGCSAQVPNVVVGTVPTPTQIVSISNITNSSAVIQWAGVPPFTGVVYTLRYRVAGSGNWTVVSGLTTTFRLVNGLQSATDYEVEVSYRCPNNGPESDFSTGLLRNFRTTGPTLCSQYNPSQGIPVPVPGGVYVSTVTANSAVVNWNAVADAAGYIVSWGLANTNPGGWPQAVVCNPTTQFTITGLVSSFSYQVRVRTNCSNCTTASQSSDLRSDWSQLQSFQTLSFRDGGAGVEVGESVLVYPNPSRGVFTVRLPGSGGESVLELVDASGRRVWSGVGLGSEVEVDATSVGSGLYLLRAVRGSERWQVKVVID